MNPELQQLKDIHLPPAINAWPMTLGWIVIALILFITVIALTYFFYRRYKNRAALRIALGQLTYLKTLEKDNPQQINIAAEISTLLRRTALNYFQRQDIAGLFGNAWLEFLNQSGKTTQFTTETGRLLLDAPYRHTKLTELMPLFHLTHRWLLAIGKNKSLMRG